MRLVTRSDFDGLVCAMILKEVGLVGKIVNDDGESVYDIKFVHPKDVQDGKIELTENDITTNLPYDSRAGLVFDHHSSELERLGLSEVPKNFIVEPDAPSAARVVYNYYKDTGKLGRITDELMEAVDKGDSANFTKEEILDPKSWVLMNFIMDARTGLGRFHDFRISNYQLMMELIDYCLNHTVEKVLELPDVKERTDLYFEHQVLFKEQLERIAKVDGTTVILDLRNEETIYAGNRFMVYAMHPECLYSAHVAWGFKKQNTAVMIGKSIINKAGNVDIGQLCLTYGGGGHFNAGTCQLDNESVDALLPSIIMTLNN